MAKKQKPSAIRGVSDEDALLLLSKGGEKAYLKREEAKMDAVRAKEAGAIYQGKDAPDKDQWEKVGTAAVKDSYVHGFQGGGREMDNTENVDLWQKKGTPTPAAEEKKPERAPVKREDLYENQPAPAPALTQVATAIAANPNQFLYNKGQPAEAPTYDPGSTGPDGFLAGSPLRAPERALDYAESLRVYNDLTQKDLEQRAEMSKQQTGRFYQDMANAIPEAPDTETGYEKVMKSLQEAKKLFA